MVRIERLTGCKTLSLIFAKFSCPPTLMLSIVVVLTCFITEPT